MGRIFMTGLVRRKTTVGNRCALCPKKMYIFAQSISVFYTGGRVGALQGEETRGGGLIQTINQSFTDRLPLIDSCVLLFSAVFGCAASL